ncbi:hypothetical protein [Herbaspirillum rubrisubalbicans]|nr:hypothetical protein [Herbaspirillum rubrisubalbicans]
MSHKRTAFWISTAIFLPPILGSILPEGNWTTAVELVAMIACAGMLFVPE